MVDVNRRERNAEWTLEFPTEPKHATACQYEGTAVPRYRNLKAGLLLLVLSCAVQQHSSWALVRDSELGWYHGLASLGDVGPFLRC